MKILKTKLKNELNNNKNVFSLIDVNEEQKEGIKAFLL